ncbi:hypothetical protein POM88_025734 [Heracleum sosnowskyi]|uniref:RNase H type-1 domain-containing protein n=1 Tax=Heracleum sosnowskyi TaxID=360622 RepID=A0AAD8MK20_9APIA|nr:hypothetical protein POM88_025734 [Heracleum sosnowskyi]
MLAKGDSRCSTGDWRGLYGWSGNLLENVSHYKSAAVLTVCLAIWRVQNEKNWNWKDSQGRSTEALVQSIFAEEGTISWVKPQLDSIKVTVDTTIFEEQATFVMGMVARDSKGDLVQACKVSASRWDSVA